MKSFLCRFWGNCSGSRGGVGWIVWRWKDGLDQVCLEFSGGGWCWGEPGWSGLCGLVVPLLGTSSSPVPCHVLATRTKQMEERCWWGEQWQPLPFHSDSRGRQRLNGGQWLAWPEGGLDTPPPGTPGKGCLNLAMTVSQVFPAFRLHGIFTENTSVKKNQKDTIGLVLPLEGWRSAAKWARPKHRIGLTFQINQINFRRFEVQREIPFTPQRITLHPLENYIPSFPMDICASNLCLVNKFIISFF